MRRTDHQTGKQSRSVARGEAILFVARPDETSERECEFLHAHLLTEEERIRADRFATAALRHDHVVACALVRLGLSDCLAAAPDDWRFDRTRKPFVVAPANLAPFDFSLSHTRGLIALLVTDGAPGGVDLECIERANDLSLVAPRICAPSELEVLHRLSGDAWRARFFELWTLKEAYAKALGVGLLTSWKNVAFTVDAQSSVRVRFASESNEDAKSWQFWLKRITPLHQMAVAIRSVEKIALTTQAVRIHADAKRVWLEHIETAAGRPEN